MNFTTNQFGQASPFSQQMSATNPPMLQGGQYTGPNAMTPMGQMPGQQQAAMPGQHTNPMQSAQPMMTPEQKMMLVQMLQNMGNRQQQPIPQMNLAGVTGSTLPNNFLG